MPPTKQIGRISPVTFFIVTALDHLNVPAYGKYFVSVFFPNMQKPVPELKNQVSV